MALGIAVLLLLAAIIVCGAIVYAKRYPAMQQDEDMRWRIIPPLTSLLFLYGTVFIAVVGERDQRYLTFLMGINLLVLASFISRSIRYWRHGHRNALALSISGILLSLALTINLILFVQ